MSKASRRKESSSSTTSGSESASLSQEEEQLEGLFSETNKAKGIAERYPGALTYQGRMVMQESLLTEAGEDFLQGSGRPVSMMYFRSQLQRKAGGAQARELITLCSALDHLLRGRPAQTADILTQRIKSCEAVLGGAHWSIAQRLEVPTQEVVSVAQRMELAHAQKESYQDSKTRYLASGPSGGKGDGKGKSKGKGKGKDGDYGKGGGKKGDHGDGHRKDKKKEKQ